jgi:hypothetical protein
MDFRIPRQNCGVPRESAGGWQGRSNPRMAINVMATFMPEFHTYAALPGSTQHE